MIPIQVASAHVVERVLGGKNLDKVLRDLRVSHSALSAKERAAVYSISFDTLRHYGLLAAQLDALVTTKLADPGVRALLLVALSQLQFSQASAHAIVDHAVSAVATMGHLRAKPLVNAVLRRFGQKRETLGREAFPSETVQYDFPEWWIKRLRREQPEQWQRVLRAAASHPPMGLRVNVNKTTPEAYLAQLAAVGLSSRIRWGAALVLDVPVNVDNLPGFQTGLVSVQDEGAQLAALLLGVQDGMRVLDACAAPGGKSGHLCELADIELVAIDQDAPRLFMVESNLRRLGKPATVKRADAGEPSTWWDGRPFERILLDAPCSGSGVVRRHPDIKWLRRESDLNGFARQQGRLLAALWKCLAEGGRLLYCTCSVFRAENQEVIARFGRANADCQVLDLGSALSDSAASMKAELAGQNGLLLPDEHHDGFYFALLEKRLGPCLA